MTRPEVSIAVVYNEENTLKRGEPGDLFSIQWNKTVVQSVCQALESLHYSYLTICLSESLEPLKAVLAPLSADSTFVFNLVDEFDGEGMGEALVIELVEQMGFGHTGAPPEAIRLCTDKPRAKEHLLNFGVATPAFEVLYSPTRETTLPYPLMIKPVREDGSLGISFASVATTPEQLFSRVAYVLEKYHQPALVECYIPGREFAVSLWGNGTIHVLPLSEMDYSNISDPLRHILTYNSKWDFDSEEYQSIPLACPADLDSDDYNRVIESARAAYHAMGLRDFGRVDIRYHNCIPYVIDINEIPDLSEFSGFTYAAQKAGYTYAEVIGRILQLAMHREGMITIEH
jgi:D-alanine-D-alanine ligase